MFRALIYAYLQNFNLSLLKTFTFYIENIKLMRYVKYMRAVIISLCIYSPLLSNDYDIDFDNPLGNINLSQIETYDQAHPTSFRNPMQPDELATFFLTQIKSPFWKYTKAPTGRDILYLLPHKITAIEHGGIAAHFFFNMTDRMNLTTGDLIDLEGSFKKRSDFLDMITNFLPEGASSEQVEQLLPFFQKITLQERKSGALLQVGFVKGPCSVQIHTSVQLGARNLWLSPQDRAEIEGIMKDKFGVGQMDEKEMYRLRIGMGDTRIKAGINTINASSMQTDFGFEGIIPTSRFSVVPRLRIGVSQATYNDEELAKSSIAVLRAMRDYLLMPRLGNNGHFGFGCYLETKVGIFREMMQMWMRISYDVLFPNEEDRLFMFRQTITPEQLQTAIGTQNIEKMNDQYIQQYIFPSSFKADVEPGGILNFVLVGNVDFTKRIRWALGYDFYAQQEEHIRQIYSTSYSIQDLRVEDAQSPSVAQHKIFSEIFYHNPKPKRDVGIGLGGDITVANRHIGADWTLYCKIASSF